jgi:hypothetical protein
MDEQRRGTITIGRRFNGPPDSGNGGYTAGLLAACLLRGRDSAAPVQVTLRRPPPLDTELEVRDQGDSGDPGCSHNPGSKDSGDVLVLCHGGETMAEARPGQLSADPVEAVSPGEARDAETRYPGLTGHPFPTCFSCGPDRDAGDALRLFPGRLGDGRTACTWRPGKSLADEAEPTRVRSEFVWAALDCPGGWTADIEGRPMVLGRITAKIDAPAEVGERHVVMGRLLGQEGRKTFTTTTLYDSDGRVVARAQHVWFAVDPTTFR